MCSCTSARSKKLGSAHSNEGAKVSNEEVPNKGKTSAENLRVGCLRKGMAKPAGSRRGARGSLRRVCSPNCASHRGFGTFEGIVCRDIRHRRVIHGAWHPNAGSGSISLIVAAGFHLFRSAVGAYSENGDNCPMQLRS